MIGTMLRSVPRVTGGTTVLPYYKATGAAQAGQGAISVPWPTHVAGDVGLLLTETANQPIATPTGWTLIGSIGVGTAGGNTATAIDVHYRVATSSLMGAVSVADPGNHVLGVIATYGGVDTSNVLAATPTTGTIDDGILNWVLGPALTTAVDNSLVILAAAMGYDTSTPQFTTFVNSNLTDIAIRANIATIQGNGGCIGIADGGLAIAGSSGSTIANYTIVKEGACVHFALRPIPV